MTFYTDLMILNALFFGDMILKIFLIVLKITFVFFSDAVAYRR